MDWYENVPPEEVPPEWMWPYNEEINNWFDDIRAEKEIARQAAANGDTVAPDMEKNDDPRVEKLRALRGG